MVALFSELSKTFKRKRFQGENALGETKVFSSSQTLIFLFTIWPSYSGFDFITIKIYVQGFSDVLSKDTQNIVQYVHE